MGVFVHKDNEVGKRFYVRQGFRHVSTQDREDDWYMEKAVAGEASVGTLRSPVGPSQSLKETAPRRT
jgi:hypothetical protein